MARTDNLTNYLTDVASAIKTRSNLDQSTKISAKDFDSWIIDIPDSGNNPFESLGWDYYPKHIESELSFSLTGSEGIRNNWDPSNTDASNLFAYAENMSYAPYLDTSNVTNMSNMFTPGSDMTSSLVEIPQYNTSNVTDMSGMFTGAYYLKYVPVLDTSKVVTMQNMFRDTQYENLLKSGAIDNILVMCSNVSPNYEGVKKLTDLFPNFTFESWDVINIQRLQHYQDFVNAGWSIK